MQPYKFVMFLILTVMLSACITSRDERLQSWRERCQFDYGFPPGSEGLSNCVMLQESDWRRSYNAWLERSNNRFSSFK